MKKVVSLFVTALLLAGLTGCATTPTADGSMKVKCPACGHEFGTAGAKAKGP